MFATINKPLRPESLLLPATLIFSLLTACSTSAPIGSPLGVPPAGPAGFSSLIYAGVGAGASLLEPEVEGAAGITLDETQSVAGNLLIGIDTSQRTAVELQIADLGEAELNTGAQIGYRTGSVAFSGRLFNNRRGLNLFGKLGIGTLQSEDSDLPGVNVVTNNNFNLVTGLGVEYLFRGGAGVRLEYVGHDTDVQFAGLNFIYHFGASSRSGTRQPALVDTAPVARPNQPVVTDEPVNEPLNQVVTTPVPEAPVEIQGPVVTTAPTEVVRPQVQPFPAQQPPLEPLDQSVAQTFPSAPPVVISEPVELIPQRQPAPVPQASAPVIAPPVPNTAVADAPVVPSGSGGSMGFDVAVTEDTNEFVEAGELPVAPVADEDPQATPQPIAQIADTDADGIADNFDTCDATPAGLPVRDDGCELYDGSVFPGIGFEAGVAAITSAALSELDRVALDMQAFPQLKLEMLVQSGSETGEEQLLARRRTLEVFRYLRSQGVSPSRLRALPPVVTSGIENPGVILRSQPVR